MNGHPFRSEERSFRPCSDPSSLRRVVVFRLHAAGDVAITLPFCADLKQQFPDLSLEYVVSRQFARLPEALSIFDRVHTIDVHKRTLLTGLSVVEAMASWSGRSVDCVVDLQRNRWTKILRFAINSRCWGEFDRYSSSAASLRVKDTFDQTGFRNIQPFHRLPLQPGLHERARELLMNGGWDGKSRLVVINPAGLWESRRWPDSSFVEFLKLLSGEMPICPVVLGTDRIVPRIVSIRRLYHDNVLDLTNKTDLGEALAVLQCCSLVISEDSGLLHMAWACGIPSVGLFGSTNHVWAVQPGAHLKAFHSGDLECGACMTEQCRYGDVHCLSRVSPQQVLDVARELLALSRSAVHA